MRLWVNEPSTPEGKYPIVLRRDGTVFDKPHFLIAWSDPCAPAAYRAYADEAERLGMDPSFVADVRAMGDTMTLTFPHRFELPATIPYRCGACGRAWAPYNGECLRSLRHPLADGARCGPVRPTALPRERIALKHGGKNTGVAIPMPPDIAKTIRLSSRGHAPYMPGMERAGGAIRFDGELHVMDATAPAVGTAADRWFSCCGRLFRWTGETRVRSA